MRTISFITIRGMAWSVAEDTAPQVDGDAVDGYCDYDARRIVIDDSLTGLPRTQAIIHEIAHAASPDISEGLVEALEESISIGLTILGYDLENPRGKDA